MNGSPEKFPPEKESPGVKTILVVDDEDLMLRLLKRFLSRHGYQVFVASDGEQALEVYRRFGDQIDAVLLDDHLPLISGEEVFRRMKGENAAVKVVMASGFFDPLVKTELHRAGVKHCVNKPYALNALVEILRNMIEDK